MFEGETCLLPPEPAARWRREYVTLLRWQYEGLDRWSSETGEPVGALIRKAVDDALRRRGVDAPEAILEAPR